MPIDEIEIERYELTSPPSYRFEVERRDFMRIFTAVGGGLLVASVSDLSAQQESGRGGQQGVPSDLQAWIHVDGNGRDHRAHRQDRDRTEHQDVARAGGRRRASSGARRRHDPDGRHRSRAVRSGHVRIAVDAPHGAGTRARGRDRARDADRSRRAKPEAGSRGVVVRERTHHGPGPWGRLRRSR